MERMVGSAFATRGGNMSLPFRLCGKWPLGHSFDGQTRQEGDNRRRRGKHAKVKGKEVQSHPNCSLQRPCGGCGLMVLDKM